MKKILFFLLAFIYVPLMALMAIFHDKEGNGRYDRLWDSKSYLSKGLFIVLAVIFFPIMFFMRWTFDFWTELAD